MVLLQLLLVGVALCAVAFGAQYASTHSATEVDAYLTRSRAVVRVIVPLAVVLIVGGVAALAIANAV